MKRFDNSERHLPPTDSPGYTTGDLNAFDRLAPPAAGNDSLPADFPAATAAAGEARKQPEEPVVPHYSAADDLTFEQLTTRIDAPARRWQSTTSRRISAADRDTYSREDAHLFDSLSAFASGAPVPTFATTESEATPLGAHDRPASAAADAADYTQHDLATFAALTPGGSSETGGDRPAREQSAVAASSDADVGYIKIVDFDRVKANGGRQRGQPHTAMKIRFFD